MLLSPIAPRPRPLPAFPTMDIGRIATEVRRMPDTVHEGVQLGIQSTAFTHDGYPMDDWYLAPSHYAAPFRMNSGGFVDALAAATQLARTRSGFSDGAAVVQDAANGDRYLVPLGLWDPADESELSLSDIGGVHWTSATDHTLVSGPAGREVEAVVLDGGATWLNFTGHPVRLQQR